MNRLLVTGTDTGVGKTYVTVALARELTRRGRRVVAIKPVETGCLGSPSPEEDGARLALATGQGQPRHALYRFTRPVTPALAAELEGRPLELGAVAAEIERAAAGSDLALIEGAGGLLSPVSWTWSFADLARTLSATALIVTPDRLGCLNHTLLTLRELDRAGIPVAGVVLSAPDLPDESSGDNAAAIRRMAPDRPVLAIGRDPAGIAGPALAEMVSWLTR